MQHPENADSQPVDPQVPRRVHISRTELHYQQLLAEGQAAIAAAENQDPPVEVFVPVAQRARQPRRPRAETPLRLRLTRMNRLFSDVRMPKSVVERIQPSNNVL